MEDRTANMMTRQAVFDSAAIAASCLCVVHCLLLPLLIILIPMLGAAIALPESVHRWALGLAAPTSVLALMLGWRWHRRLKPTVLAVAGLVLMAAGIFAAPDELVETALTVAGAVGLSIGHTLNWQALRH